AGGGGPGGGRGAGGGGGGRFFLPSRGAEKIFPADPFFVGEKKRGGGPAMTSEQQIRNLIKRWAAAVHDGDMHTVLASHAPDIVMFDVPPPEQGVRGLDAYRQTWPPFFEWQAAGAVFEIESLDITAGDDVGFAFGLLQCGTPEQLAR